MRTLESWQKTLVGLWLVSVSIFTIYTATIGVMQPRIQRGVHLLFLLPMAFILFPVSRKYKDSSVPFYDWILAFLSLLPPLYHIIYSDLLDSRLEFIDPLSNMEIILGLLNIILLLEAIRRVVVPAMSILIVVFIGYLYYLAPHLSGVFFSKPLPLSELVEMLFILTDSGIYGSITGISATFVALFVIFGAFMESTQTGKFFTDLACRMAGKSRGGPAKVAVISSAFFGSISGVAAANVYATGTFTIPMMKKLGFRPRFAGAVEAVSSSGGQYMPPIMGAGAFVMSEITGIPYLKICMAAVLPALLYYSSLVIRVHFTALRENIQGMKEEDMMIPMSVIIKDSYLLSPIVCLIAMLLFGYSVFIAAMAAIVISFIISFFKKSTAMTPRRLFNTLRSAGEKMVMISLACAGAGMVVSIVTHTGLALGIATVINHWSGGFLLPGLFMIMITALILGMGMPCTPAYIIAVTIGGPALGSLGVNLLPAHLMIFYYAILAEVTPPVCIPAFCAASIAGSEPLETGFEAFKLALVAFTIPIIFTYNEALLLNGNHMEIISLIFLILIGIILLSGAFTGYFFKKINLASRIILSILALSCFVLSADRNLIDRPAVFMSAIVLCIIFSLWMFFKSRRAVKINTPDLSAYEIVKD